MENIDPKLIGDDTKSKKLKQFALFNIELNFYMKLELIC
jgi:hypothetical protein